MSSVAGPIGAAAPGAYRCVNTASSAPNSRTGIWRTEASERRLSRGHQTAMAERAGDPASAAYAATPLGCFGKPIEIAEAVL